MGCLASTGPKSAEDETVQQELNGAKEQERSVKKLLLLGAGGSGKSTLFKQLQNIHGGGFSPLDRKSFRSQIYEQIIESMKAMITRTEEFVEEQIPNPNDCRIYQIKEENGSAADYIQATRNNQNMTADVVKHLKTLWDDPAIKAVFEVRNRICVPDSTSYFLDHIDRITSDDYIPNEKDLLLVRYRTTGMAEKQYLIDKTYFKICDVGGQRSERRKWIHFFDSVTAVVFVAALSSYDEVTFEDESINSMQESLEIFGEHVNSHWFENTAFILFLNKNDLFEVKITKVPITVCFKEYKGPQEYQLSLNYIREQFEKLNKIPDERQIYTHVTCATDVSNIQRVFNDVQHIVINWSLQKTGLI